MKRKNKLAKPSLQLKLVLAFFCTAALAVIVQAIVLNYSLSQLAGSVPNDRLAVVDKIPMILGTSLTITFLFLAPLTLGVGILVTFRVAGPLTRFEDFLGRLQRGENPPDCRIRRTDELHDFCDLLNEVTAPLRSEAGSKAAVAHDAPVREVA